MICGLEGRKQEKSEVCVFKIRKNQGFTLIELMIVVVIIGILAALAMPRFMSVSTKTKQSEAKLILKQIYVNQRTYRQQGSGYFIPAGPASAANPDAFSTIWVSIPAPSIYTYTIVATTNTFTATATSGILDDDVAVDVWTIDNFNNLVCVTDDSQL
jgi:prepilin-type N-terminal cleavage/methylation domain-containing protein